ncbi:unnamed protein product [Blepharisma stoltei]|uniref:Uncharacterized protein n=1 Tax=Blepharisma stoltei TaxID=1481888 RepID=A0AAU9J1M7_9CILI|nr:unnamed protein product [Blepharisma stoltei]
MDISLLFKFMLGKIEADHVNRKELKLMSRKTLNDSKKSNIIIEITEKENLEVRVEGEDDSYRNQAVIGSDERLRADENEKLNNDAM